MNIFELLWVTVFLGGGALVGYQVGRTPGMFVGMVVGSGVLWLIAWVSSRYPNDWPTCSCGANIASEFSAEMNQRDGAAFRCKKCGTLFELRKGATWEHILPDGTRKLVMTRTFGGRWKPFQVGADDGNPTRHGDSR